MLGTAKLFAEREREREKEKKGNIRTRPKFIFRSYN